MVHDMGMVLLDKMKNVICKENEMVRLNFAILF